MGSSLVPTVDALKASRRVRSNTLMYTAYVSEKRKPAIGTQNAYRVELCASEVRAMIAGKTAPPETEATMKDAPRLVWRPRPRIAIVKMVGKMQDSEKRIKQATAMDPSPLIPWAMP